MQNRRRYSRELASQSSRLRVSEFTCSTYKKRIQYNFHVISSFLVIRKLRPCRPRRRAARAPPAPARPAARGGRAAAAGPRRTPPWLIQVRSARDRAIRTIQIRVRSEFCQNSWNPHNRFKGRPWHGEAGPARPCGCPGARRCAAAASAGSVRMVF